MTKLAATPDHQEVGDVMVDGYGAKDTRERHGRHEKVRGEEKEKFKAFLTMGPVTWPFMLRGIAQRITTANESRESTLGEGRQRRFAMRSLNNAPVWDR